MYKARKQNEANHRAVRPPLVINHLPASCKHFHLESAFLVMQIFGDCASTKQGAQEMRIHKSESSGNAVLTHQMFNLVRYKISCGCCEGFQTDSQIFVVDGVFSILIARRCCLLVFLLQFLDFS
ncbi:hypothetical protein NC652_021737 [Populus alba x Populus x berolinensis]|nr:hypothetical protein NC652_021737 [Populus alba x Populus x berolinensis]